MRNNQSQQPTLSAAGSSSSATTSNPFGEAVKPPFYRYILAHTAGISGGIGIIGALALMLAELQSQGALVPDPWVLFWIALAAIPTAAIGFIVGIVFLWGFVLGRVAAWLQGWPFAVGDRVWILSGEHKDTLTTVYAVCEEIGLVHVDLGPELKNKGEDFICGMAVCRARNTEPDGPPHRSQTILPHHATKP